MNIENNQQLYEAIRKTSAGLEENNLNTEAKRLNEALTVSTLPGEILGEVGFVLEQIKSGLPPHEIYNEIDSEIAYINSVLK